MSLPVLTFTGNPLAESTFDCPAWHPGGTFRARGASFQVGGKGINVSKMLRRLGAASTALTFLGGDSGSQCLHWLTRHGFGFFAAPTLAATRTGLVVRSPDMPETTFLGPDTPPDAGAWQAAAAHLPVLAPSSSAFAFCGSSPGWASEEAAPFRAALLSYLDSGKPVFVDTYGAPLLWLVEHPVELVKINATEFKALLGNQATGDLERDLLHALARWPVHNWIITDGPAPVWLADKHSAPLSLPSPDTVEISPTGCGDVLFASLLHARLNLGKSWLGALHFALPFASANASHPGIAEFPHPALLPWPE